MREKSRTFRAAQAAWGHPSKAVAGTCSQSTHKYSADSPALRAPRHVCSTAPLHNAEECAQLVAHTKHARLADCGVRQTSILSQAPPLSQATSSALAFITMSLSMASPFNPRRTRTSQ